MVAIVRVLTIIAIYLTKLKLEIVFAILKEKKKKGRVLQS